MNVPRRATLIVGIIGLSLSGLGWVLNADEFFAGWTAAVTLLTAWSVGSMALLLIHALTGGRWGQALQPVLRMGVCSVPLLWPSVLPVFLGLRALYPWARPGQSFPNHFYLNVPFFELRGAIYLISWLVLGWLTLAVRDLAKIAAAGLVVLALTASFAAIDTTMSIDPHFVSSVYGMLAAAGMGMLALSVAVLLTAGQADTDAREDFGKLLLALVVLWTYLDFMQLLIIWQSDLASEAPWYIARSRGYWGAIRLLIAAGHFVLPFFLLLSPAWQRSPRVVLSVGGLLIAMEVLRAWWTVLPALGFTIGWIDAACVIGLGACALYFSAWAVNRAPIREAGHV
jgi:hypothetical protein